MESCEEKEKRKLAGASREGDQWTRVLETGNDLTISRQKGRNRLKNLNSGYITHQCGNHLNQLSQQLK